MTSKQILSSEPHMDISELLAAIERGEVGALNRLMPLIYAQLRSLASRQLRRVGASPTLSTKVLVHEAYERLAGRNSRRGGLNLSDERHLLRLCARVMHQVLIDHARESVAAKRGGVQVQVQVQYGTALASENPEITARLSEALTQLTRLDPELAELAELAWLAGLENAEVARVTGMHLRQVQRDLKRARAWVMDALTP
jgi:RNA polymerase sigma factor (TIGR02999 family)